MIINDQWDQKRGRTISIEGELLASHQSKYQTIEIFNTKSFGKLLRLDGVIQLTEFDEKNYHEMISQVPFHCIKEVKNVLIVGGGDGGAAREILKHEEVERVDLVEIDKKVIELCRSFFLFSKLVYKNKKLNAIDSDAFDFVKNTKNKYDLIIIDSTDPFSIGEKLFSEDFFINLRKIVNENGVVVTQSESMFYDLEMINQLQSFKQKHFKYINYYYTMVPTYPSGTIGFSFCSNASDGKPTRSTNKDFHYYNKNIHKASFILPNKLAL